MIKETNKKVDVNPKQTSINNPFGQLDTLTLPAAKAAPVAKVAVTALAAERATQSAKRGRIEVRRETGGRGGKTVTTVKGFQGVTPPELATMARELRNFLGSGGTVNEEGIIEVQGDQRDKVLFYFEKMGFKPVLAGG